jgi:hypothetical protein
LTLPIPGICGPDLIATAGSKGETALLSARPLSPTEFGRRSVSEVTQLVAEQPENAVAAASPSSAPRLLHSRHRTSIGSEWFVSA